MSFWQKVKCLCGFHDWEDWGSWKSISKTQHRRERRCCFCVQRETEIGLHTWIRIYDQTSYCPHCLLLKTVRRCECDGGYINTERGKVPCIRCCTTGFIHEYTEPE